MKITYVHIIGLIVAIHLLWGQNAIPAQTGDVYDVIKGLVERSCGRENGPGVAVFDLKNDRLTLGVNLEKLYIPASNAKIITSLTALKMLRPDYTFKTTFYIDGKIKQGTLQGNLYIKGFGDPDLVPEQVWRMVTDLRNSGLQKVEGDLVADDTFFDDQLLGPGWDVSQSARTYQAPISALSVNFNTVSIKVLPGAREGEAASIYVDPRTRYIQIKNSSSTGPPSSRSTIAVSREPVPNGDLVTVTGNIPSNSGGERHTANITKPTLYALTVFHEIMKNEGVVVTGETRTGKVPPQAAQHLTHESRPLSLIVWGLNKFSNNFIAEQILKTMGAEFRGEPGTFAKGIEAVQTYMKEMGVEPDSYVLVDGSGLSPKNRLSAAQIIQALRAAYADFELAPEFMASLAVMGTDGSVSKRLRRSHLTGNVRTKTGSLNGVSALSGYAPMPGVGPVAFSFLMNGGTCDHYQAKELQNKILLLLLNPSNSK